MKFSQPLADVFVPDATRSPEEALGRTTHLCIAAHQDDIEIMAYHGIAECFGQKDRGFGGVVVTNGAGSPRAGIYAECSDEKMREIRRLEQRKAALVGDYAIQIQLAHASAAAKNPQEPSIQADLAAILSLASPEVVYLHQPADKHDTHIGVLGHALKALRAMPAQRRPRRVYGCEVWRDLDWLSDGEKQTLDVSAHPNIAAGVLAVFDSQIGGGKRYDLAVAGRRLANATFHASHATDKCAAINWAMDLTPLVQNPELSLAEFVRAKIDDFQRDVVARVRAFADEGV